MKEIVLATRNPGKVSEIVSLLPGWRVLSLDDIGFIDEIPEPFHTFEENAATKAKTIFDFCGKPVISDDSGICVPALNGAPGVDSAHYAGLQRSNDANNQKLLEAIAGKNRAAYYVAVICYIDATGGQHLMRDTCEGTIAAEPAGIGGFGYDPIFIPTGYEKTLGELPPALKKEISHRAKAVKQLISLLQAQ